jgi:hypothetical protein
MFPELSGEQIEHVVREIRGALPAVVAQGS